MRQRDWVRELRGATFRRDGVAVVALARDPARPPGVLQLLGDGLAVALDEHGPGAAQSAADCVAALRERGWTGDAELADQLDSLTGSGPTPMLRSLAVDLEQLADMLEGDPIYSGGAIDLKTGDVWPRSAIEDYGDDLPDVEDSERFLWVHSEGSRAGYRDMELFIATIDDPDRADRLSIAISGRGAFRRFKDVLDRWPGELERWHEFSTERQRGRARAWLADAGYRAATRVDGSASPGSG